MKMRLTVFVTLLLVSISTLKAQFPFGIGGNAQQSSMDITACAFSDKPITSADAGRKDKTFKTGEVIYACIKFSNKIRDKFAYKDITVIVSGDVNKSTFFSTQDIVNKKDHVYKLSDAEIEKSELSLVIFPPVFDLNTEWMAKTYFALVQASVAKKKIECKVKFEYTIREGREREKEFTETFYLDFTDGVKPKWTGDFTLGKPAMTDAKLEKEILSLYEPEEGKVVKIQILSPEWQYMRNQATGVIVGRQLWTDIFVRNDAKSECDIRKRVFYQDNQGGNNYGKLYLTNEGISSFPVPCEKFDEWFKGVQAVGAEKKNEVKSKGKK